MRRHSVAAILSVVALFALTAPAGATAQGDSIEPDLAVTLNGPAETPGRGDTFPLVLEVSNLGAKPASDVTLSAYVPSDLTIEGTEVSTPDMTCATGEWGQFECKLATLEGGASSSVILTVTRTGSRETWVDLWAAGSFEESNWDNNWTGISLAPDRSNPADVQVTVDSTEQPEVGEAFTYVATVTNRGPELARGVTFTQSVSDGADLVSFASSDPSDECTLFEESYEGEDGSAETYTYREVRCTLGNMAFAEQTTITLDVVRNDPHEIWSSAWIQTDSFDDNYENDWADATTAGHPSVTSDLAMTVERPAGLPLVGDDFSYTMTVTNHGPASVGDVVADSWLPDSLSLRAITPTRDGDVCEQTEYQGISCTFGKLAVGESTTVVLDVTRVRARQFWMGGSVWSSNYDPNYENNYVEDQVGPDKSVMADLSVVMDAPKDPAVGSTFDYTVDVTNNGPDQATGVSLTASVPEDAGFVSVTSPDASDVCTLYEETYDEEGMKSAEGDIASYTYREIRCELGTLVPAETASVTVTLQRNSEYELWGSAWAQTASYDNNEENDYGWFGTAGKTAPPCAASDSDDGTYVCAIADSGGSSSGEVSYGIDSKAGKRVMRTGKGNDRITLKVPTNAKRHRKVIINAGKGNDVVNLVIAPGAGRLTIIVKGGGGRDTINAVAPQPGKRFKLRMWGGKGNDTCSSAIGERHRSRSC